MAYSDDAVRGKLSALNETQDSIVTVAQWIMFHRRHADRTAALWHSRLASSATAKRLNLVYLANEVVQQSKARRKTDFLTAFEPIIADAVGQAYRGAPSDVQAKLRRVVEVWRERSIFADGVQGGVEAKIAELDNARREKAGASRLGGSLFGSSGSGGVGAVPAELQIMAQHHVALTRAAASIAPLLKTANDDYSKMTSPATPLPTPPVHAAKLSALLRALASAQTAVESSLSARKALIADAQQLLATHRSKADEDEVDAADLARRKSVIEAKKREVEDGIMRGLSAGSSAALEGSDTVVHGGGNGDEIERPEVETFTPPGPEMETLTPTGSPLLTDTPVLLVGDDEPRPALLGSTTSNVTVAEQPLSHDELSPAYEPPPALPAVSPAAAAANFLDNFQMPPLSQVPPGQLSQGSSLSPVNGAPGDPRLKRRKISHLKPSEDTLDEQIFGGAGMVDEAGVEAILGNS